MRRKSTVIICLLILAIFAAASVVLYTKSTSDKQYNGDGYVNTNEDIVNREYTEEELEELERRYEEEFEPNVIIEE